MPSEGSGSLAVEVRRDPNGTVYVASAEKLGRYPQRLERLQSFADTATGSSNQWPASCFLSEPVDGPWRDDGQGIH